MIQTVWLYTKEGVGTFYFLLRIFTIGSNYILYPEE